MRAPTLVLLAIVLALAGVSALAWQQHRELAALRTDPSAQRESDTLRQKLAAEQKRARELEAEVAALKNQSSGAGDSEAAADKTAREAAASAALTAIAHNDPDDPAAESKREAAFELLGALADTPEFQKLLALHQRGAVDAKYGPLFGKLNLSPEQQQQLERLLADKQGAFVDALVAARDQGLTGKEARAMANSVARATQKEIDASIKSLLGDQGYDQYRNFERTMPQRETVNQLAARLSYTANSLSPQQQEQLVQTLTSSARQETAANKAAGNVQKAARATTVPSLPGPLGNLGGGSSGSGLITTTAVSRSAGFLSTSQVTALQQMQQEQQAQLALAKLLRNGGSTGGTKPAKPKK